MRIRRQFGRILLAVVSALALTAGMGVSVAQAAPHSPISGTVLDAGGFPASDQRYSYDNVSCTETDRRGVPIDVVTPDDYGGTVTDDDGSFTINALSGHCYLVYLLDEAGRSSTIVYEGVTAAYALLKAGSSGIVIAHLPNASKPVMVTLNGATKGTLAQLWIKTPAGSWNEQAEGRVGDWTSAALGYGWPDTSKLDTSVFFLVNPGETYTVSYGGDAISYPQFAGGGNAFDSDIDKAKLFTAEAGDASQSVAYSLSAGSLLKGRVTFAGSSSGTTTATAWRIRQYQGFTYWAPESTATVAANGSYTLGALIPGERYTISADNPNYLTTWLGDRGEEDVDLNRGHQAESASAHSFKDTWEAAKRTRSLAALRNQQRTADDDYEGGVKVVTAPAALKSASVDDIRLASPGGIVTGAVQGIPRSSEVEFVLTNLWTGESSAYQSLPGGRYQFPQLPSGVYLLTLVAWRGNDPVAGYEKVLAVKAGKTVTHDVVAENRTGWSVDGLGFFDLSVTGEPVFGQRVSVKPWLDENDVEPTAYEYTWVTDTEILTSGSADSLTVTADLAESWSELGVFAMATAPKTWRALVFSYLGSASVEAPPIPVVSPRFTAGAEPMVGKPTTVSAGTWSPAAAVVSYQWYTDDMTVPGATGPTYTPKPGEENMELGVMLTISVKGHAEAFFWMNAADWIAPGKAVGLTAKITGTAKVGKTLKASAGPAGHKTTYEWLRNGEPIDNATKRTYKVAKADAGMKLSVRLTVPKAGHETASKTSAAKSVPKFATTKLTAFSKAKATSRVPAKYAVKLKVKSVAKPTGTIKVTVAGYSKTHKLKASAKGKLKVTLPRLPRGKHKVTFAYSGTKHITAKKKTVKLVVR